MLRVVRETGMDEGLGLGRASDIRRCVLGGMRDLSVPGWAGRSRQESLPGDVRTGVERRSRARRVDVGLGRRCGHDPPALRRSGPRDHLASDGHAVECAGDARTSPGRACVQDQLWRRGGGMSREASRAWALYPW